jgi:hypothetical protein
MYRAYYRPGYNIPTSQVNRNRKLKQQSEDVTITAETVWGAAAYADRINGGEYRKEPEYRVIEDGRITDEVVRQPNKIYMWGAIRDNSLITVEDRRIGREARDYIRKNLVVKGLKNAMSDFDTALSVSAEMDEFNTGSDRYEIALVTSQIRAFHQAQKMDAFTEDVDATPVAEVGAKVSLHAQVVKAVFSTNYNVYFVTAKTESRQMVFFSYRERLAQDSWINLKGTVKAHRPDATQLNRVRIQ